MMNSFVSEDNDKWLMFNAKFSSADEVYESIYRRAKKSIYVVYIFPSSIEIIFGSTKNYHIPNLEHGSQKIKLKIQLNSKLEFT